MKPINMTTPRLIKSIGSSSSRLALLFIALVFACLGIRQNAQAGYIVTLQEVGPNVVATGSGAFDLAGLTFGTHLGLHLNTSINPQAATIRTGLFSSLDTYSGASGPVSFGGGATTSASSGGGVMVGIGGGQTLFVPGGYVSGTFLSGSATYSGRTVASLGVTPGTYLWRWGNGANQNFTLQIPVPPPGPPAAITNPATLIASFSARLNGSVNPHGLTTSVYFQYGTTNSYGLTTAPQSRTGNTFLNISATISGLTASTTYHFRMVTTNSAGTRYGSDETFYHASSNRISNRHNQTGDECGYFCGDTQWFTRSAWVDHERLFSIRHHDQLRAHHGCAEPDWKHLQEYRCQRRWPG